MRENAGKMLLNVDQNKSEFGHFYAVEILNVLYFYLIIFSAIQVITESTFQKIIFYYVWLLFNYFLSVSNPLSS